MSRYIDADEFYVSQTARCWGEPLVGTCTNDNVKLYDEIQKFTTADVAEVVRCKDCKYFLDKQREDRQGICMCGKKNTSYAADFYPYADDFCSYGERKDEE